MGFRGKHPPRAVCGEVAGWHDDGVSGRSSAAPRARRLLPSEVRDARRHALLAQLRHQDGRRGVARRGALPDRSGGVVVHRRRAGWRPSDASGTPSRTTPSARSPKRYLVERDLRPTTVRSYQTLLDSRILPYFGEMPLRDVTLSEVKKWRASLDPQDRVVERRRLPAAALRPPGSRGGGADRPRATEDPWRRLRRG